VRVAVTGAAGYLGSRLCTQLKDRVDVVAIVRREVPWLPVEQVVGDLTTADIRALVRGVDTVVHLAGANEAAEDVDAALAGTVVGTHRLAAALARATRVVYVSTFHVYGVAAGVVDENVLPAPRHPYAVARLASEHLLGDHDTVVLRLTNSVGAPVDPAVARWSLVANDLCRQAAVDGALTLRSHGLQWRDFVHQRDACDVIEAALDPAVVAAGTYNLGRGEPMTVRALAGLVQDAFERLTGSRPPLHAPDAPVTPPPPVTVSVARLASLGLAAQTPVRDAVEETARFCLDHRRRLGG
jgi:UDP-glucose 4-epimerase